MELMSRRNSHMSSMREEKRALQLKLQGLDNTQKGEYQKLNNVVLKKCYTLHTIDWLLIVFFFSDTLSMLYKPLSCFIHTVSSRLSVFQLIFNIFCLTESKAREKENSSTLLRQLHSILSPDVEHKVRQFLASWPGWKVRRFMVRKRFFWYVSKGLYSHI